MIRFWWRRDRPLNLPETWQAKIKPPVYTFTGHDESLHVKAMKRRAIAESIKQRSALVASGSNSGTVLKIARKA